MTSVGPDQILAALSTAARARRAVVLATIVATEGSVPRHTGAKMLIYPDAAALGTVGGGKVEDCIRADALSALADRNPNLRRKARTGLGAWVRTARGAPLATSTEPVSPTAAVLVIC